MPDETPLGLEPRDTSYDPLLDAAAQIAEERRAELEEAARELEQAARRRVLVIGAVVVVAVVCLSVVVALLTTRRSTPGAVGVGTDDAFSADGLAVPGAVSAQFSPDGARLAVLRGGGAFGVSEAGRFRPLVPAETAISSFAWYDSGRLLVQEGPVSTGQLAALDLKGESKGVVKLDPDVAPGAGMAVSPDRRTVVLAASVDPGTPGSQPVVDLYAATVPGGATRRLTDDAVHESHPVFLDDHRVAFTSRVDGNERVNVLDLDTGAQQSLTEPAPRATVLGVAGADVVWTTGDDVRLGHAGAPARTVASVPSGTVAVALSPDQKRLVLRETSPDGDTILKLVRL
jgi:hypothetical protein